MLLDSSAVTLAAQKVRAADRRVTAIEKKASALASSHKSGRVSTEHYLLRTKMLAAELERAISVDHDALRDFYEAVHAEAGREAYEESDDDLTDLLSLSAAGGT